MRVLAALFLASQLASAQIGSFVGERLRFQVTWSGMTAGYADMMCLPYGNGAVIRTVATANSAIQSLYPVYDTLESVVQMDGYPLRFAKKVHEGSYWANFRTFFRRGNNTAVVTGHAKGKPARPDSSMATTPVVYDMLSAFYEFRTMDLKPGDVARMDILDNRKMFHGVEIHCLRRERIKVPAGTFDCVVIEPKIHSEALFKAKGSLYIWLTEDARRLPVRMESRISLGRIRCDLLHVTR